MSGAEKPSCIPDADKNIDEKANVKPEVVEHEFKLNEDIGSIISTHIQMHIPYIVIESIKENTLVTALKGGEKIKFEIFKGDYFTISINGEKLINKNGKVARFYQNFQKGHAYSNSMIITKEYCDQLRANIEMNISETRKSIKEILPGVKIINDNQIEYEGETLDIIFGSLKAMKSASSLIADALRIYKELGEDGYIFTSAWDERFYPVILRKGLLSDKLVIEHDLWNPFKIMLGKKELERKDPLKSLITFLNKVIEKGKN